MTRGRRFSAPAGARRGLLLAAAGALSASCLVSYHPVLHRPPAAILPVELNQYALEQWPFYLDVVAQRNARVRRFVWANANEPPCSGGALLRWADRQDSSSQDLDIAKGQRLRLGRWEIASKPPMAGGPTALDVEEVLPAGGTVCLRIPVTGNKPEEQWSSPNKWVVLVDLRYGRSVATAGAVRPLRLDWALEGSVGLGRWLGPIRVDGALALGTVGCSDCMEPRWFPRAGVEIGAGILAWEGKHSAIEINGAYRFTVANDDRDNAFPMHGPRVGVGVGLKPAPVVGILQDARDGFGGIELFSEWQAPLSSQAAPHLLVGIGLLTRMQPF